MFAMCTYRSFAEIITVHIPEKDFVYRSDCVATIVFPSQEAGSLRNVRSGVSSKGAKVSAMVDGVQTTRDPRLFKVFSTSGMAAWWLVDMSSGLCNCPNDSDVCSHIFAVCSLFPRYRIRTAALVKVGPYGTKCTVSGRCRTHELQVELVHYQTSVPPVVAIADVVRHLYCHDYTAFYCMIFYRLPFKLARFHPGHEEIQEDEMNKPVP